MPATVGLDALTRLEPVARPLLRQVDEALQTLGAPADHDIWSLLRRVGATPADAVAAFAELPGTGSSIGAYESSSGPLRGAAVALREQAEAYGSSVVPATVPWAGGAGEAYATRAAALAGYLHGDDGMVGRLRATACYVDEIADWQGRSRDRIARALAAVLSSAQAVTLRGAVGAHTRPAANEILAAADIGSRVLAAAADSILDGHDVHRAWADRLDELPFHGPVDSGPGRFDATIRLTH